MYWDWKHAAISAEFGVPSKFVMLSNELSCAQKIDFDLISLISSTKEEVSVGVFCVLTFKRENFILTYPLFCTCHELLISIINQICDAFSTHDESKFDGAVGLLKVWLVLNPLHIFTYGMYAKLHSVLLIGTCDFRFLNSNR